MEKATDGDTDSAATGPSPGVSSEGVKTSIVPRSKYKLVFLGDEAVGKTVLHPLCLCLYLIVYNYSIHVRSF
jgi:hypothetical protein